MRIPAVLGLLALAGCGPTAEPLEPGEVRLTTGQEPDAWSEEPAVASVEIDEIATDGSRSHHDTLAPPAERFPMAETGVFAYDVRGNDDGGTTRVTGRSLPINTGSFGGGVLPLFVGRAGRFNRPPGDFATPPAGDVLAAPVAGRYLLVTGPSVDLEVVLDGYDFGGWGMLGSSPRFVCEIEPCRFRTLCVVGTTALVIGESLAVWFDTVTLSSGNAPLPDGLASYDDLSGGLALAGPESSQYVVGATRAGPPSRAVLRVLPDGSLSAHELLVPREGAAAVWVEGAGLVVAGGSADGAGAELLADGADTFVPLSYPSDATAGAGLAALDSITVLRAGGKDPSGAFAATVELALECGTGCTTKPHGDPVELDRARVFALEGGSVVAVGTAPSGDTGAVLVGDAAPAALPLRDPRRDAIAMLAPTGQVAVLGGVRADGSAVGSIELFSR